MSTEADFLTQVRTIVTDESERFTPSGDETKVKRFIQQAVQLYSKHAPFLREVEFTGDGTKQEFAVPSDWQIGFSDVVFFEVPIDEVPIRLLDIQDNLIKIQRAGLELIQLPTITLATGKKARIFYKAVHVVDGAGSTIPDNDFFAVCDLAGSIYGNALALFYAESIDGSIGQDIVDHQAKADRFRSLADRLKRQYKEHMTGDEIEKPALILHDVDLLLPGGEDYLTHPSRTR